MWFRCVPNRNEPGSLNEWAEKLSKRLNQRQDEYSLLRAGSRSSSTDNELCRVLALKSAALALVDVLNAMKELPQFAQNNGLAPLLDVASGLHDLTIGGRPRILERAAGIGTGQDGAGKSYVKRHAAIAVLLLEAAGLGNTAARKLVARELSGLGFKGRKGGPLSPGTLFDWVEECRGTPGWDEMKQFVEAWAGDQAEPLTQTGVLSWIRRVGSSPLMQSQI
jgi:hypothetical protein